ncbi:MAG: sterol desaturase family protein [Polyangiaceae bacterium]|nr:sterol desaturase family protein [Polyangiaceae bacterium]
MVLEWIAPTAASFLLLAVVFGPLERLFPARPGQRVLRKELVIDACFFVGQYLAFSAIAAFVLGFVHRGVGAILPADGVREAVRSLHPAIQGVIALVLGDLVVYWFHRACHRFEILWRFHAVHHSVEELDWLAAHREHPLDGVVTQIAINLPGIALGVSFEALGALVVLRGMWAIFIHSNISLPVGPLRYVLGEPALHHWHHARVRETEHNFANLAPYLDLLFGTYHRPEKEDYELGLVDSWPRGYLAQLVRPFVGSFIAGTRPETAASTPSSRPVAPPAHAPNAHHHAA